MKTSLELRMFLKHHNWCRDWYAKDENGKNVDWWDKEAASYSLMGAILYVYPESEAWEHIARLGSLCRTLHNKTIENFNDSATWEEVQDLLRLINV